MNVSVFGLGYVGAVSAACLARDGHTVTGCDIDAAKLALLRRGNSPIVEPGMEQLLAVAGRSARLRFTESAVEAVAASDVSLVCVGTPADAGGSQDLAAIRKVSIEIGSALASKDGPHLVAVRSTLLPGTTESEVKPLLEAHAGKRSGVDFDIAFVPEFLREGSSIADYDRPPFTILGVEGTRAEAVLRELYGQLPAEVCVTSIRAAELLKYCCNAFHALKVTFANEIGRLAQTLEVDAATVMQIFCKDRQLNLSAAYLRPGFAFGGPCLPKDVQALVRFAELLDVPAPVLSAILPSNEIQIHAVVERISRTTSGTVGLLGLSFKSGTDDLRTSPLVALAQRLLARGREVKIFDPTLAIDGLVGANRKFAFEALPELRSMLVDTAQRIAAECRVLVIGRNDPAIVGAIGVDTHATHVVIDLAGADGGGKA